MKQIFLEIEIRIKAVIPYLLGALIGSGITAAYIYQGFIGNDMEERVRSLVEKEFRMVTAIGEMGPTE